MLPVRISKFKVRLRSDKETKEIIIEAEDYSEVYEQALMKANRLSNLTGKTWTIKL